MQRLNVNMCQVSVDAMCRATGETLDNVFDFTEEKLERVLKKIIDPHEIEYVTQCLESYREGKTIMRWSEGRFIPMSLRFYLTLINNDEAIEETSSVSNDF